MDKQTDRQTDKLTGATESTTHSLAIAAGLGNSKWVSNKCIAVRKVATPLQELTCHMGSFLPPDTPTLTCQPSFHWPRAPTFYICGNGSWTTLLPGWHTVTAVEVNERNVVHPHQMKPVYSHTTSFCQTSTALSTCTVSINNQSSTA